MYMYIYTYIYMYLFPHHSLSPLALITSASSTFWHLKKCPIYRLWTQSMGVSSHSLDVSKRDTRIFHVWTQNVARIFHVLTQNVTHASSTFECKTWHLLPPVYISKRDASSTFNLKTSFSHNPHPLPPPLLVGGGWLYVSGWWAFKSKHLNPNI